MKIIAVASIRDEADIIGRNIDHLRTQGVDEFILSCEDEASLEAAYAAGADLVLRQLTVPFHQSNEMTQLAHMAYEREADWVVPFDADEFWVPTPGYGDTVRAVLASTSPDIDVIFGGMYVHLDWDRRAVDAKPLGKVVFRPRENSVIDWGQHFVTPVTGELHGVLSVRELQYRDRAHFDRKIARATALHATIELAPGYGTHMQQLIDMSDDERDLYWKNWQSIPTIHDPIGAP